MHSDSMAENVHGIDVSWMSKHSSANSKDHHKKHFRKSSSPPPDKEEPKIDHNGTAVKDDDGVTAPPTPPKSIPARPGFSRSASSEKTATMNGTAKSGTPSPNSSRRNSWLSSISSKFGASPVAHSLHALPVTSNPTLNTPPSPDLVVPTGPRDPKNALLPHAQKAEGDVPYTPAPPRHTQPNFLQSALRKLSSSSGQSLSVNHKAQHPQHGLCERRILNIDHNRERCKISELDQSKLRRVAFCVDVEIASGPHYIDEDGEEETLGDKKGSKKIKEKDEGLPLKHRDHDVEGKEASGNDPVTTELSSRDSKNTTEPSTEVKEHVIPDEKESKKKEKKKRSEEERKARKEKKRKLAEANGTLPVELIKSTSDSSLGTTPGTPKAQISPTTDPVRIYRRCCQLRETPILKKITEQLGNPENQDQGLGIVHKLDLTGYWLQLPDLITLGDYLAVVPVKELVMENCGLTDEGARVVLAGLLGCRSPDLETKIFKKTKDGEVLQGGFVERVVIKNNPRIGKEGWYYIATFITMSRSLKSLDVSQIPFPQSPTIASPTQPSPLSRTSTASSSGPSDASHVLGKAIGSRLAGKEFELLNLAEVGLTTDQLGSIIDGVIKSGLRRLGLAGNNISAEGIQHVARYIQEGKCEGLDLGGNDLKDQLGVVAEALGPENGLYALSLADCSLTPESLWVLFPALAKLCNFRFIDLSQNHSLFTANPSALSLLRGYLPKMPTLKRIHLSDVAMTAEQAIALAEILPESPNLAHLNILENPSLAALANAKDEASQEEACALYASLMAAVRVSKTIICVDIEVPAPESSEVVKALAKQVVAYCLWNMERGPVAEISEAATAISETHAAGKDVAVPDVLLHLVGHVEGFQENHDDDDPAPDDDYVIGGTGVVKALGICLRNRTNDARRPSADRALAEDGGKGSRSGTPKPSVAGGKAKDMSKNLLGSARKIRARLQPALVKESKGSNRVDYQRLLFLDQTLEGMIKRFEDEFPETRVSASEVFTSPPPPDMTEAMRQLSDMATVQSSEIEQTPNEDPLSDTEEGAIRPMLSRHNSDVSIASRALSQEEGRIHRFGQQFRRDILNSNISYRPNESTPSPDRSSAQKADDNSKPIHVELLRAWLDGLGGEEIKRKILNEGYEKVYGELTNEASELRRQIQEQDPEGWDKFVESQEKLTRNLMVEGRERAVSALD